MHDVLIVGLPMVMILAGILLNRSDAKDLRSEMKDVRSEMKDVRSEMKDVRQEASVRHSEVLARFNVLEADMRQFYHLTGKLEARMDAMEKR